MGLHLTLGFTTGAIVAGANVVHSTYVSGPRKLLTRSLREPGGPCTKSMEVSESRMERVKGEVRSRITIISKERVNISLQIGAKMMKIG